MMHSKRIERLLTTSEVADWLHKHPEVIRLWVREGAIPALRCGKSWRFSRQAVRAWMETKTEEFRQDRRELHQDAIGYGIDASPHQSRRRPFSML